MSRQRYVALLVGCAGFALSGCVAAVIPVAASGLIGGSKLRHDKHPRVARQRRPTPVAAAPTQAIAAALTQAPTTPAAATPVGPMPLPALPTDLSAMKVGQTYSGTLPSPTGATPPPSTSLAPTASPATLPTTASGGPARSTWSDVVHFVAASSLDHPTTSVLLAKGSTMAMPHWLPCGDKPAAVLIALPDAGTTTFVGPGKDYLAAIQTMGLQLVFASDQPGPVVAQQLGLLKAAGVSAPVAGTTLFTGNPGQDAANRAAIGSRYCVVAIAGTRATDFPDVTLPGTPGASPGWFLIR